MYIKTNNNTKEQGVIVMGVILLFFLMVQDLFAQSTGGILITEIMYDPLGTDSGREWVEVYYEGLEDITSFYLRENEVNHTIKLYENHTVSEKSPYLIIADNPEKFLADFPEYKGYLFDSAFSLKNTGELLQIVDKEQNILFSYEYIPPEDREEDSFSLHIVSTTSQVQEVGVPSPGNSEIEEVGPQSSSQSSGKGISQELVSSLIKRKEVKMLSVQEELTSIDIPEKMHGLVGVPLRISPYSQKTQKKVRKKFSWSYGDGSSDHTDKPSHTYQFPGEYLIIGSVRGDDQREHVMYSKVIIEENPIVLKEVNEQEGYFVIENTSKNPVNIEKFRLIHNQKKFIFPDNTVILGQAELKIALAHLDIFEKRSPFYENTDSFILEYPHNHK